MIPSSLPARPIVTAVLIAALLVLPVPGRAQQAPPPPPPPPPAPQQPAPPPAPQPQRRVVAIEVRGNRRVPTERILAAVTHVKVGEPFTDEPVREDLRAINELGLFTDVTARTETVDDGVRVVFIVTENPLITEVIVEGTSVIGAEEIRRALGVPTGEVLNLNRMREGTRAVQKLYADRGYVLARITDTATVPVEGTTDQARLRVRIAEGVIEDVRFQGLRKTRPATARRHIRETTTGTVFNANALNRDLQRLFDTGLFESIRARPEPGADPDTAVVIIDVTEARTAQIGGGVGYSSRDGLLGFVEYRDRNWRGLAQTVALRAERGIQGAGRFNYEVTFQEPFLDAQRTAADLGLYSRTTTDQEYSAGSISSRFELQRTGAFIALTRPLDPTTTGTLRFRSELTEITPLPLDASDPASPVVAPSLLSPGRVISFALTGLRDTRDDRLKPTRGERISLSLELGLQALGGDFGFTKYVLDYQRLFPVGANAQIVGRLLVGTASGTLPLQEQFLLGGSSTVRALPGGRFRANSIAVVNLEYRFPLGRLIRQLGEMQGIVFVDAGSAPIQPSTVQIGYGVGVAIGTPIGPVRIDFAFGPEGRQTWISIGAPF